MTLNFYTCVCYVCALAADCMSFMFESYYMMRLTPWALQDQLVDENYYKCWQVGLFAFLINIMIMIIPDSRVSSTNSRHSIVSHIVFACAAQGLAKRTFHPDHR